MNQQLNFVISITPIQKTTGFLLNPSVQQLNFVFNFLCTLQSVTHTQRFHGIYILVSLHVQLYAFILEHSVNYV